MSTWVSWCDDGVTVICDRIQCQDEKGNWWQEVVEPPPGMLLAPKDLSIAIDEHEKTHRQPLPLHRTEASTLGCSTCDGGGCPDCTDPA